MHANWLNGPRKWCYQYVAFYSKVKQESCNENISPLIWIVPFIFFRVLSCRQNDIHKKVVNFIKEPLFRCCESVIHDQLSCNSRISWCNPVVFALNIIFIICVVINVSIFFLSVVILMFSTSSLLLKSDDVVIIIVVIKNPSF